VAEVRERQARGTAFHLLDVREDREFVVDHAEGARHLGRGVLERDIEKLIPDRDAEIVLYCGGGFRSALAAESLGKMGYRNVWSMDGGMRAWREAGAPVEPGSKVTP
jgi:rhodanese-related sulfurtransferase